VQHLSNDVIYDLKSENIRVSLSLEGKTKNITECEQLS